MPAKIIARKASLFLSFGSLNQSPPKITETIMEICLITETPETKTPGWLNAVNKKRSATINIKAIKYM